MGKTIQKVLLVDDELMITRVLKRFLVREGYDVFEAGDAAVALRLFEEEKPFHMLLCDVNLGVDNGMKLAEQIRMAQPSIRVLMLSGALLKEKDERTFSVLYKPFNQEEFRRAIDELRKEPT